MFLRMVGECGHWYLKARDYLGKGYINGYDNDDIGLTVPNHPVRVKMSTNIVIICAEYKPHPLMFALSESLIIVKQLCL